MCSSVAVAMSIAALSCVGIYGSAVRQPRSLTNKGMDESDATATLSDMSDHSNANVMVTEMLRMALIKEATAAVRPRLADDDNYMLKPTTAAASGVAPLVSSEFGRPRSASLSLVTRLSSPRHHPARSHPPTPPPPQPQPTSFWAVRTMSSASSSAVPAAYGRLLCACLPTCCCDCNLLSSIAECQAVYHQTCARYVADAGCCQPANHNVADPAATNNDAALLLPQTVPQDVVSWPFYSLSLIHI